MDQMGDTPSMSDQSMDVEFVLETMRLVLQVQWLQRENSLYPLIDVYCVYSGTSQIVSSVGCCRSPSLGRSEDQNNLVSVWPTDRYGNRPYNKTDENVMFPLSTMSLVSRRSHMIDRETFFSDGVGTRWSFLSTPQHRLTIDGFMFTCKVFVHCWPLLNEMFSSRFSRRGNPTPGRQGWEARTEEGTLRREGVPTGVYLEPGIHLVWHIEGIQ